MHLKPRNNTTMSSDRLRQSSQDFPVTLELDQLSVPYILLVAAVPEDNTRRAVNNKAIHKTVLHKMSKESIHS